MDNLKQRVLSCLSVGPARWVDIERSLGCSVPLSVIEELEQAGQVKHFVWVLSQIRHYYRVGLPAVCGWQTGDEVSFKLDGCQPQTGTIVGHYRGKATVVVEGSNPENLLPFRLHRANSYRYDEGNTFVWEK